MDCCSALSIARDWRSCSAAVSPGLLGTASGTLAPTLLPASRLSQRPRRSCAVRSQICLAQNQPTTGRTTHARAYQPQNPANGILIRKSTASAPIATSSAVPSAPACLSSRLAMVVRSVKTSSQTRSPGRKSTPHSTITAVSQLSRSRRMLFAARQCSTTTCGSAPKDWMRGLRPLPSMRVITAVEKASPRLGRKIFAQLRPPLTTDWCNSLLVLRISSTGLSR